MNITEVEKIINHFLNCVIVADLARNTVITFTDDKYITGTTDCIEGTKIFIINADTKRIISWV